MQAGDIYRSLLQFDVSNISPVSTIESALLNLYMYRNEVVSGGAYLRMHRLLNHWEQETATWNNQPNSGPPGFSPAWDGGVYITSSTPPGLIAVDISDLVRGWINGSIANNGLLLAGNELENKLVGFMNSNYQYSFTWPTIAVNLEMAVLDTYDPQELVVPSAPADPSIASASINLGSQQMVTFLVANTSSSTSVRVMLQVGYGSEFYSAGPWHALDAYGSAGATIAISTGDAVEQARVLIEGAGGETVTVTPRSRE